MTLQREVNPLPPGRYWLDVFEQPEGQTEEFLEFTRGGLVDVESTEEFPADGTTPRRTFFLFRVKEPGAVFNAEKFGFPNIAPDNIKSSADTALVPEVDATPTGPALRVALVVGAAALVVAGVVYLIKRKAGPQVVLVQGPALG